MLPTDPYFLPYQWHLLNFGQFGGRPGVDLNVVPVWEDYTGANVTVGVFDAGTQVTHPDLQPNWDPDLQPMMAGHPVNPSPYGWGEEVGAHGTAVAGLILGARNGQGIVGVAYDATFGVGIYDPDSEAWAVSGASSYEAFSETLNHQRFLYDVTNSSYGTNTPLTDQNFSETAGIESSVILGRNGLGTINVIAAGNEKTGSRPVDGMDRDARWSTDGGFEALRQTVSVAAGTNQGDIMWYSNPGASLLVTAPVSYNLPAEDVANTLMPFQSTTTDLLGTDGYSVDNSPEIDDNYSDQMAGTSAAAPMVTGVVALMLEANPALGYRDVQEILALSARPNWQQGATEVDRWQTNGADHFNGGGMRFSHDYGFGFVDALAAVRIAETWTEQRTRFNEVSIPEPLSLNLNDVPIPDNSGEPLSYSFEVTDAFEVEWIEVGVAIEHEWWGDLAISVISPAGTESRLLVRPGVVPDSVLDYRVAIDDQFDPEMNQGMQGREDLDTSFVSTASRGESTLGTWTVQVWDLGEGAANGELDGLGLQLYGNPEGETTETFFYTDRYADLASAEPWRQTLATDGEARINAAAVTSDTVIHLTPGITGEIAGTPFRLAPGSQVTEAIGGDGADALFAATWDSILFGGRGDDLLFGNAGADILVGGRGTDLMRGAAGADRFVFETDSGRDRIADFDPNNDLIEVDQAINGQILAGPSTLLETAFTDAQGNAVINLGAGNQVTLLGLSVDELSSDVFSLV
ncbi:S8 family serine peptidase [Thiorhodovibrio frisius]|uniref:Regulatory P domain of subtilisin-like proprotein convertases n=1 Tax=Thiorhodovibrio frisius TaxID=631362 RepID=H8Z1P6_9GAMM|nr:S8 family serine peptidase [Thiorhodovibrio frisius]EIC21491.1 regulatory P domain of subtilisin-like proprotein convertases [Thiorhodovibrio frisius]WPL24077.1 Calcium-dependent protease precursor [Thiorhodovibrio frisius]